MKQIIVKQPNAITSSRNEFSALEKNLLYMIINDIKDNDTDDTVYSFTKNDLSLKIGGRVRHEDIDKATDQLLKKIIKLPPKKKGSTWLKTHFVGSAEYFKDTGVIELTIHKKVIPIYRDLKNNFTLFNIEMAFKLKSKYSKKLYEILSRWKDFQSKPYNLETLKLDLGVINFDGKDKYERFSTFENKVLKVAQKELKEKTDINFSYTALKTGRKYTDIHFNINIKEVQKQIDFKDEIGVIYSKLINKHKLSKFQAEKIIRDYTPKEIHSKLYQINIGHDPRRGTIGGYTAKQFGV